MEEKSQAWCSLLEDSSAWNDTNDGAESTNHLDRAPAASTFINSATPHRAALPQFSALASSCGQILSPIHQTSTAAVTLPYSTPSKISDYLTEYSITKTDDLVANITHKSCDLVPQSNLKCTNTLLQSNDKEKLPILRSENPSQTSKQRPEEHAKQTPKDVHITKRTLEDVCKSKTKTSASRSLVFPFPSDHNLYLQSSKRNKFETGLGGSSPLSTIRPTDTLKCQIDVNAQPAVRKSFPDLFNPSLPIRAEPAGRDIPDSLNQPSPAPLLIDDKENKVPVLHKRHNNVSNPNLSNMNSVIIESTSKEQVRYKKISQRNIRHNEVSATSASSDEGMDAEISKVTGYATNLSTLLDYMTIDERVKLLPPSTLKSNVAPDPGGPFIKDAVGGSYASTDSSPIPVQKGLSHCDKDVPPLSIEKRSNPAWPPVNQNVTETEDSMMPPVVNRDNFIPVGSESNIQTIGKGAKFFRGVTVGGGGGGGGSGLSKKMDANIHITISKATSSLEVSIDNPLPIEERERFLPTGADSESLDRASSSSCSNISDDDINGSYQSNRLQNQILNGSLNPSLEPGSTPPHKEFGVTELLDTVLEGATASCITDAGNILAKKSAKDYMDIVEREKYIKTDLFDAYEDLPKNTGQKSGFKDHFDYDKDKSNVGKSEPDLLLGHSLNFGISDPDLHPIIAFDENVNRQENSLSDRKSGFVSDPSLTIPPSITIQDFENHTRPIMVPAQPLPFVDFTCPNEEEEDDTDELINMVSSVLLEPNNGISPNKSDPAASAGKLQYRSPIDVSDVSTPSGNPHLSQSTLHDNVSTATSNPQTESGRGTLGSSDVSNSPLNGEANSKTQEDQKSSIQDISCKTKESSSTGNITNLKTENIDEVQTLNSSHESLRNVDKSSEVHSESDASVKVSHLHLPYSERTSRSTDLYLPLSVAVKRSMDNTMTSDLSSARSYENDQSLDSDILGRQVNSLLCRTAYLEYRNQTAQTSKAKNESSVFDQMPRSATPLVPSTEVYDLDAGSNSTKSSYTEKEGLNYDQLEQDLTDLQNGLTQGLHLKNPILKDEDVFISISESINKIDPSKNSPDVLQDSRMPTNLFRKTTQQQADLLLGMDRILRKKEDAFESAASVCLPLLSGEPGNEIPQKKEWHESGATQNVVPRHPFTADVETASTVPDMVFENKPKRQSQTIHEPAFANSNQMNNNDNATGGVSLGSTQGSTRTPHVSDELALRVERILSEEPLYSMNNLNFLERVRPKTGFFRKLSFSSDCKSTKTESISDRTETDSGPAESQTSKDSFDKCPSDPRKSQEISKRDQDFKITGGFENNAKGMYFGESVASKESSENFNCSTLSDSSHSMDSFKKEKSLGVPDSAVVQPSRKNLTNDDAASDYPAKTETFGNSRLAFVSSKPFSSNLNGETQNPHLFTCKEDVPVEPINFGHNETLPYPVDESSNSIKFLDEDVRRCLDWSNMSTFSSPPKETVPAAETVNLLTRPEMVENIADVNRESNFESISNIPKNDPKQSQSGIISTTNSSHSESECHSLKTVASVHAISAERKLCKSSQLESHLQEEENFQQTSDVISASSSSSSRNQNQKILTDNISTRKIDLSFSSEDLRQLSKNLTRGDSLRFDNDMYISNKSNSPQKSPYKLSLSESQPDFHPQNQTSRKSANRSCSDISALLHSEESSSFLKPKGRSDLDSLRRDLDALSNYEQVGNDLMTPAILEREKPKENADVSSLPSSKGFPSVSPSMVVSPFDMEHDPITAVSQLGDCSKIKGHSGDSASVSSQFYESSTSREFVIGKASSSTSSTNQSRTSSAWISSRKSTSKGKKYDPSFPVEADDKLETTVKYPLDQQRETAHHVGQDQPSGIELNHRTSKIYEIQTQSERTETKSSSNGTSSSPSGSEDSVASDKTWTLRPYKPASSHEWYYTNYCDDLITGESGTTTLESADTGSDDAIGPPIPKEFLGSRVSVPSRPGIYSRSIHKKNIPIQEDLLLSTIHEKSFVDEKDCSGWILEKKNPPYVYKANEYSAKSPTIESGNLPTPGTKSAPRNKDFRETRQIPQRIEQLVSKENIGAVRLDPKLSPWPTDVENLTEALYDDCKRLETDDVETRRENQKYPEKLAVNQSVIDLQTKNSSSFESGRTTIDSPSGFTDPDNVTTDFLRRSDPTLSSDESDQLPNIACTIGQCHPLVRYAPVNQWNSAEVQTNPNPNNVGNTSCLKKPGILSQRGERVVRSSKELDLLWEKFKQQDHSSDHESSLDSARLGHMQQLLKNPTHALVHHSLAKKESIRLKQAKMAARKMEEQKRALLCSKIQDESSSISGSLYSNRNLSSPGIMRRDEGSISSRPSCTTDTLSSVAEERQVGPHQVGQPGSKRKESESRLSDPIMAQLREKIDKQRKKCQQTKLRDKASEQKLQKLTHILLNRQMNDLVLAAEMRRLSTTSTASMTTASETLPESQWQSSCKNQPPVTQKKTNPVSKQQTDRYHQKDRHPLRLDQNGRPSQNSTGQEVVRVQRHYSKPKEKITRNVQNHKIVANSPDVLISEQDDASNCSDFQRRKPRMKDATTMVPSPKIVTDETSDDGDSCQLIKASIAIQTSPPRKMLNQSRQPNVHVAKQAQANRTKSSSVKKLGTTTSPHKAASVEEVQVIPVPFLSTPKRYKNITNEAIDKASHNNVEKTSVNKGSDSWFVSLTDQPTSSTHSSRQRQQHTQLMRPFTGSPKAKGRQNKLPPRKPQGLTKKSAGSSRALVNHAVVPAHRSPPESSQKMLAITNEKFNGIDNQITLQDAFNNHMQCWISRSRERQKRIALAADERRYQEQMELEREEIFLNKKAPANNIIPHPFSDNLHQPKKRDLSKKEIKELNQRFYKKLPEVVQHKVLLNRASEYRTNRIRSRMFSMRVQKSLLTKTTCR